MWIQAITCLVIVGNFGHTKKTDDKTKFPQPYQFGYTVNDKTTGDIKSHQEVNDGRQVRGRYSLVEPTGDLRVVTYTADRANGFQANVNVEARSQPQPTPTYRLVKLPPLQKLRRQHDESTDSPATLQKLRRQHDESSDSPTALQKPRGQQDDSTSSAATATVEPADLDSRNDTEREEIMTVLTDKDVPQGEHQQGNGEGIEKNTFNIDHLESAGPQMIPVKIEKDTPGTVAEVQRQVLNVDLTSVDPLSTKGESIDQTRTKTTQKTNQQQKNVGTPQSQTKAEKNDDTPNNNNREQSVIKSTAELQPSTSDSQPTQLPTENSYTTIGNWKTSQSQLLQNKNHDMTKSEASNIKDNVNIQDESNTTTIISQIFSNNSADSLKTTDMKQNNMMLAALLLPTTPILKFTCTPDHSDKTTMMSQTIPNAQGVSPKSPRPISLGPGGSVFTPSIPLFPFQLVNFSPIKQIFTNPQNIKPIPQKPNSLFATRPPFPAAFSTVFFQNTEPKSTAAPQQITTPEQKNEDVSMKAKPPNGYTNLRSEGSASQAHKVQSSYYTHHLLPPPWAPHPLRPPHNSHYRHMPIFVLPMSHNYNFAPTFDPDLHNH